ncbi:monovalent cation/H(+) antiporter subunit G [Microtetraspora niveoalba]|uniref:monovalent cation/H(+) antiporter subunit G n=1 Tax=Microtetraspora niveoalba TaxID=46175 RepID=UPI000831AA00|nr:monovalent cation/H(+) antiporter subunit G [Microtetraspora niveoalba]
MNPVAEVLVGLGVLVALASSVGAVLPRDTLTRLHFVTPVTSLAAPLVGAGLAVDAGWSATAAMDLLIVLVLAATGPVLAAATAQARAQRQGLVTEEAPE